MILICGVVENGEFPGTFDVSLTDGEVRVTAEAVVLWDTEVNCLEDVFYQWLELAQEHEPGLTITY